MPGTPEEYMSDSNTSQAIDLIDQAISEQKSGSEIINMLEGSGLRVYASDESEAVEEPPMEEPPMEEPPMEEDEEMGEELGEEAIEEEGFPVSEMGLGDEPGSGEDGGMRGMRINAVRFALDKDKKNKEQIKKDFE